MMMAKPSPNPRRARLRIGIECLAGVLSKLGPVDVPHCQARPTGLEGVLGDFPLRGFVLCDCCGKRMTAAWSKGRYRHYPYYLCMTRGCEAKSKSVPRAKLEDGFAEIIKTLQPAERLFDLAKAMLCDAWDMRLNSRPSVYKTAAPLRERLFRHSKSVRRSALVAADHNDRFAPP
jgi:hypothetical protein